MKCYLDLTPIISTFNGFRLRYGTTRYIIECDDIQDRHYFITPPIRDNWQSYEYEMVITPFVEEREPIAIPVVPDDKKE